MSIHLVTAAGVVIGFLYLLVVIQLFRARRRNSARTRREDRIERQWLPILVADSADVPDSLPSLDRRDVIPFLTLWNQLQESFTGDITNRLNDIARRAGMDVTARRMLERHSLPKRLLAISTLGHLGNRHDYDSWNALATSSACFVSIIPSR